MRKEKLSQDDLEALEWFIKGRWPKGAACPHCSSRAVSFIKTRGTFQCKDCRKQFSVFLGTRLFHSRLRPSKNIEAMVAFYEIKRTTNGFVRVRALQAMLGITYTASYKIYKIMADSWVSTKPKSWDDFMKAVLS